MKWYNIPGTSNQCNHPLCLELPNLPNWQLHGLGQCPQRSEASFLSYFVIIFSTWNMRGKKTNNLSISLLKMYNEDMCWPVPMSQTIQAHRWHSNCTLLLPLDLPFQSLSLGSFPSSTASAHVS